MRKQCVLLEHRVHRTHVRRRLCDFVSRDTNHAFRSRLETRNQSQKRRLATTRRAEDGHKLTLLHIQIDVIQSDLLAKILGNTLNFNDIIRLLHILLIVERKDRKIIIIFAKKLLKHSNMKKIAYFFAVGAMSLAACSSDPAYKISGTVEGVADGEYVYLQEGKGREWIKVDSAAVAGGAFTFNGRQDAAAYRYITYNAEGKRYRADFFLENGNIAVALGETSTATGTPNNDLYQAYKNEAAPLNKAIAEISKKFREGNLTDEQKEDLNKQYEELDNKLTALTHSTIENNITNIVGLQLWPSASYAMELAKLQE